MKASAPASTSASAAPATICQTPRHHGPSTIATGAVKTMRQPETGAVTKAT
jgi:hypothetical protein